MKAAGSGALNLDLIYEVQDLENIRADDINLLPGRETWGSHSTAKKLLAELEEKGKLLTKSGGGSAANTICALARLGFECHFIGSVGRDDAGDFIMSSMKGVDCSLVKREGKSSLCIIVLEKKRRDRAMFVAPGQVKIDFDDPHLRDLLSEIQLLHLTSIAQENGPFLQKRLLSTIQTDAITSFDPGEIYAARGKAAIREILKGTDILFSTGYELDQLFGKMEEREIILKWLKRYEGSNRLTNFMFFRHLYPPIIAKKMGGKGAAVYSLNDNYVCSAKPVREVVDNTGAGDAFNAGLLAAILRGKGPYEALCEAVSLAAFSLGFPGRSWIEHLGQQGIPSSFDDRE